MDTDLWVVAIARPPCPKRVCDIPLKQRPDQMTELEISQMAVKGKKVSHAHGKPGGTTGKLYDIEPFFVGEIEEGRLDTKGNYIVLFRCDTSKKSFQTKKAILSQQLEDVSMSVRYKYDPISYKEEYTLDSLALVPNGRFPNTRILFATNGKTTLRKISKKHSDSVVGDMIEKAVNFSTPNNLKGSSEINPNLNTTNHSHHNASNNTLTGKITAEGEKMSPIVASSSSSADASAPAETKPMETTADAKTAPATPTQQNNSTPAPAQQEKPAETLTVEQVQQKIDQIKETLKGQTAETINPDAILEIADQYRLLNELNIQASTNNMNELQQQLAKLAEENSKLSESAKKNDASKIANLQEQMTDILESDEMKVFLNSRGITKEVVMNGLAAIGNIAEPDARLAATQATEVMLMASSVFGDHAQQAMNAAHGFRLQNRQRKLDSLLNSTHRHTPYPSPSSLPDHATRTAAHTHANPNSRFSNFTPSRQAPVPPPATRPAAPPAAQSYNDLMNTPDMGVLGNPDAAEARLAMLQRM